MTKKKMSISLSVLLASSLTLAACSTTEKAPAAGGEAAKSTEPAGPVEFTIMAPLNTAEAPTDTVKNELERLTNTKLKYQFFPADTYEEKLNATLATGALPEVVYLKNQATFITMKSAIRDGQFWEIGPYLKDYPNLSKLKPEVLNNTKVDGKLYSLYRGVDLTRQGIIYRKDWADKLGLKAPETTEDLYAMMKAFTEQDPDGNGKKDTIGVADRNDLVYGAFKTVAAWLGVPNNWGEKDGKLQPEFAFPEYIGAMDYFKKLRDEGLINKDFAATSKTDQTKLFTNGTAGMYIGAMTDVETLHKDLVKNVPTAVVDVHSMVKGPSGKYAAWSLPGYANVLLFSKSAIKDEKKLKAILAFYDKMMTPEVANVAFWGLKDVHYTLENGKAKKVDNKELIEREVKAFTDGAIGDEDTSGRYLGVSTLPARVKADELKLENQKYAVNDPTAPLESKTNLEKGVQLQELIKDATYKYIYGTLDKAGFEKAVADWKSRGGNQIIEEFNAVYKK
ncbi:carbohydrate ABC transporter substrate-binding protein, CUT1 family [Paenibacillus sp. UNCCL117]|uniref:extracellular solute-binding protein n=1 Tax=unclassified Paenibacillus TaxID=185978 RepID=UPI0008917DC8|nr:MULTISPECIES: extracellular solute-binding protein [unclassified Paenibacillus]SDD38352.1 carbohydrate ABC transporter substrate-binding protein, CUT1 family [Paenibacillus sp. cl123]SFW48593.1 carbohydrate ABC transporter substrate-binding protein, CUT1 family [Paenibacillus sp. UNCCL117]